MCWEPYRGAQVLHRGDEQEAETVVASQGVACSGAAAMVLTAWFLVEPSFPWPCGPQGQWCALKTFRVTHMSLLAHGWGSQGIQTWGLDGNVASHIADEPVKPAVSRLEGVPWIEGGGSPSGPLSSLSRKGTSCVNVPALIIRNGICTQLRLSHPIFYLKGYKNPDRFKFL